MYGLTSVEACRLQNKEGLKASTRVLWVLSIGFLLSRCNARVYRISYGSVRFDLGARVFPLRRRAMCGYFYIFMIYIYIYTHIIVKICTCTWTTTPNGFRV